MNEAFDISGPTIKEVKQYAERLEDRIGQNLTDFISSGDQPVVTYLEDNLGRELTDFITESSQQEDRLSAAYLAFQVVQKTYSDGGVAKDWFVGMNQHLDDQSPVHALSKGACEQVVTAACLFAEMYY